MLHDRDMVGYDRNHTSWIMTYDETRHDASIDLDMDVDMDSATRGTETHNRTGSNSTRIHTYIIHDKTQHT